MGGPLGSKEYLFAIFFGQLWFHYVDSWHEYSHSYQLRHGHRYMNVCFASVVPVQITGMDESQEPILVR